MRDPKKVGALNRSDGDAARRTNEIGMAPPLLANGAIAGRDITADALLTQRALADYIVSRGAHYHFTVKDNQPLLAQDIRRHFERRTEPDYTEPNTMAHGRIETRRIWCSTALNDYLDFPHVGQVFLVERQRIQKKTGETSQELAIGVTSRPPQQCPPHRVLALNRGHWRIESIHYLLDHNWDEDRQRIRTGHGPENTTRLRRFAIGLIKKMRPNDAVASTIRKLQGSARLVFDYLRMTENAQGHTA